MQIYFGYLFCSRTIVVCRLNGYIEFTELGNRLLPDFSSASNKNGLLANLRKKTQSNPSSWRFIKDSVSNQQFICHFNRAHGKTVSVVEICKDLVITASFDSLLKVTFYFAKCMFFDWQTYFSWLSGFALRHISIHKLRNLSSMRLHFVLSFGIKVWLKVKLFALKQLQLSFFLDTYISVCKWSYQLAFSEYVCVTLLKHLVLHDIIS